MANTIILPFSELQAELNDEAMIDPNAVIDITENGLYNVAKYGYANVNVEGGGETWNTVFEGNVTTVADDPAPIGTIENLSLNADTIKVTFNGTEYECNKNADGSYGAPIDESTEEFDWSTYPFALGVLNVDNPRVDLYTQTAGTYTLKIEEPQSGGSSDLVAVGICNRYNTTVTVRYFEQQGATPVDYAIESGTGIALSVPKNSGFVLTSSQYKMGSITADAFVIETTPFSSAMVLNAGVLVLESSIS